MYSMSILRLPKLAPFFRLGASSSSSDPVSSPSAICFSCDTASSLFSVVGETSSVPALPNGTLDELACWARCVSIERFSGCRRDAVGILKPCCVESETRMRLPASLVFAGLPKSRSDRGLVLSDATTCKQTATAKSVYSGRIKFLTCLY